MKVFLAGTSLATSYGGPAYSVSRLAKALAQQGIDVGLWASDGSAMTTPLVSSADGVNLLSGTIEGALQSFGKPDVIHDNGLWLRHNHGLAVVAAKRDIPRIVSTRGMLEPWAMRHKRAKKSVAWRAYQRRDLQRATGLHATTDVERVNTERLGLGVPVHVIPNGVDMPKTVSRNRKESGVRTALFLGRIYPVKGLPMLVDAWSHVRPRDWRLVIAGPDEAGHLAEVKAAVRRASLESVVSFPGQLEGDAKEAAMWNADLFILPTFSESFGMAVAEAMSFGLPVLTTTGAPWPVLEEETCGWRVGAHVADLSAAISIATSCDDHVLTQMGERGREIVASRYQWPAIAGQFLRAYKRHSMTG